MDWKVVDGFITLSKEEREERIQALIDEYVQLAGKLPHRTPREILDIIKLNYNSWLRAIDIKIVDEFIDRLDRVIIQMDIDPYWDVSFENQRLTSDVFNEFVKRIARAGPNAKKDTSITTEVMNDVFGKAFRINSDSSSIIAELKNNSQLHSIAKRLIKRLDKMGYEF